MRLLVDSLENVMTRRGLYRVWQPARKDQPMPLVASWINPDKETCENLQESEEAIVGEDAEELWIRVVVRILPDVSLRDRGARHQKDEEGNAFFALFPTLKQKGVCNAPVISPPNTGSFFDSNWFESPCGGRRVCLSTESSAPSCRFGPGPTTFADLIGESPVYATGVRRIHAAVL